ncbi:MAG: DUF3800 domain-containing protein [Candidatus Omnitrophota bacterium]
MKTLYLDESGDHDLIKINRDYPVFVLTGCISVFDNYRISKHVATKGESFFSIAFKALFNDMIRHAINVLDKNKDSASFWGIFNKEFPFRLEDYAGQDLAKLLDLAGSNDLIEIIPRVRMIHD